MKVSTLKPQTDERALLKEYVSTGSEAAFTELVGRYFGSVRGVAQRRLGDSSLADDAAQQVFILLSRKAKQLCDHPSLGAWLHRAAVLEASNLARKEASHAKKKSRLKKVVEVERSLQKAVILDESLAKLRASERQVLVLHYYEGLTFAEVGIRLGISAAAAQKRGRRALERLAEEVKKKEGGNLDPQPCLALLLAAKPVQESVPQEVMAKILGGKTLASSAIPVSWLVILGVTMGGAAAGYIFVEFRNHPEPYQESKATFPQEEPEVVRAATRSEGKLFKPRASDEDLSPEKRRFIELAQQDPWLAFEYAKEQPRGIDYFLKGAVEALADRDLPSADRFMSIVEARELRSETIRAIAGSRVHRSFEEGIAWVDSLPNRRDRDDILDHEADYHYFQPYDYSGALSFAQSPEVRKFLIEEACKRAEKEDEGAIERMLVSLKGEERDLALINAASLHLRRGDERGFKLLEQVSGDINHIPNYQGIVKRDPESLLNWLMKREGIRYDIIGNLMRAWEWIDAEAAAAWWGKQSRASLKKQGVFGDVPSFSPVVERLLKK